VDRLANQRASCESIHLPMLQWSSAINRCPASATGTGTASVHDPAIAKLLQKESEQHEVIITFILRMHAYEPNIHTYTHTLRMHAITVPLDHT